MYQFEIIVVDDRSTDDTWEELSSLSEHIMSLNAIRLQRNSGQMTATLCGISFATGDVIVTMDDDLQHPPEEVPKLIDALEINPDWDVAIGSWDRSNDPFWRRQGSRVFEWLQNSAMQVGGHLRHTGFRAMRREVGDALLDHGTRYPMLTALVLEVSGSVHNIEVEHRPRMRGESGLSARDAIRMAIDTFVQSSARPLYWISGFGFAVALASSVAGVIYIVRAIAGSDTPAGWTSTFLAVLFFGGSTLVALGLLGRYVALIVGEVRRPPRWVVRESTFRGEADV